MIAMIGLIAMLTSITADPQPKTELATFGTGCFWCTEAIFQRVKGVVSVESGYSGGHIDDPSYEQVTTGKTGHAEVLRIEFDPSVVTFETLLEVFWHTHDPTTLNRQGADVGPQYRSVIFFHNESQKIKALASKLKTEQAKLWGDPIVTEISPLINYFAAENYHQDYFNNNPNAGYCNYVIAPKLRKFKEQFPHLLADIQN